MTLDKQLFAAFGLLASYFYNLMQDYMLQCIFPWRVQAEHPCVTASALSEVLKRNVGSNLSPYPTPGNKKHLCCKRCWYSLHYVCSSERCSQDFMTTRWGTQYITARSKVTDTTKHRTGKSRLHYSIWCNVSKMILCLKLVLIKQPSWERQYW